MGSVIFYYKTRLLQQHTLHPDGEDHHKNKNVENELSFQAYYDTLTGLVNRNQLEHSLDLSISAALKHQQRFTIFFIDLDHFKHVNDTLGHDAGDQLLKIISDRLRSKIRKTDVAARLGGDEFILVLNGTDNPESAAAFAEKIINTLLEPIIIKEHEVLITASIGISFYPSDGTDYQTLIKSADLALYKAKEKGRNNYQFCTPEMNEELKEKGIFKNALRKALHNQEFHLAYLPRLDIKRHRIVGFETLLRWKDEKYGDVPPTKIIPLAEEMGIINQISSWVIQKASAQTKAWQQSVLSSLKISINTSAKHYMQSHFIESILETLNDTQLAPKYLELEITENLIMQHPDYSLKILTALKNHGIQIIIDNFGTGYSSLHYLHQFAVDYIKIDRRFIRHITTDERQIRLLTTMIELAKNLNVKILVEGVETKEQYDLLIQLGCDEIQGYYISPPVLAKQVPEFMQRYTSLLTV
jgi:diguanylate cyclase (GGDEF)-like protein